MTKVINTATVMPKNTELSLPDITAVSSVEMRETIKNVESIAKNAKGALENQNPQQMNDPKGVYKIAIDSNIWLLRAKINQVQRVRAAYAVNPKTPLYKQYEEIGLTRKSWQNYNMLSDSIIDTLETEALESWKSGKCDLEKIPSQYKASKTYNDEKKKQEQKEDDDSDPDVLNNEPAPILTAPQDHKFELLYVDLADGVDVNIAKQYVADNSIMFVWVDGNKLSEAIEFIRNMGMSYQECLIWDMGNRRAGGVFANRQHSMLLAATKGTVQKPQQCFKFKSIAYFVAKKGSTRKPHYYDDMIYNMFPDKPCLELHQGKKYNQKWFDLKDIENKGE